MRDLFVMGLGGEVWFVLCSMHPTLGGSWWGSLGRYMVYGDMVFCHRMNAQLLVKRLLHVKSVISGVSVGWLIFRFMFMCTFKWSENVRLKLAYS